MMKDTENMLMDEELSIVNGSTGKKCLSKKAIDKLCDKIEQLDVDPQSKKRELTNVRCSRGNIKILKEHFLSLSRMNHKWSEIYRYIHELEWYDV